MIRQLVNGILASGLPATPPFPAVSARDPVATSEAILAADPLDLMLYIEQCWDGYSPSAGPARRNAFRHGRFNGIAARQAVSTAAPGWDHLACSYVLENTRAVQILHRVVRRYRSGETLGVPSAGTRRWLDAAEVFLTGADISAPAWLTTSAVRADPEAVRRNAYWRLLGLDLAFGTEDNQSPDYDKVDVANTNFVVLFEQLLTELWRGISNTFGVVASNEVELDRICRLAEELQSVLTLRRRGQMLDRTELAASVVLGWIQLTLASDTPVVTDLNSQANSPAERLALIGHRVGLPAHGKSDAFFAMGEDLSALLRTIESAKLTSDIVRAVCVPGPMSDAVQRVITAWSAATGRDLRSDA